MLIGWKLRMLTSVIDSSESGRSLRRLPSTRSSRISVKDPIVDGKLVMLLSCTRKILSFHNELNGASESHVEEVRTADRCTHDNIHILYSRWLDR